MTSFPSQSSNEYLAIPNELYQFQGAVLEADHPPMGDASNKVVTTGWLQALLTGSDLYPMTSDATGGTGLLVTVSSGSVPTPSGSTCNINALTVPLAVNSNSNEYVYIRYSDCQVVISTVLPSETIGLLISLVETDATHIVKITNYSSYNSWAKLDSPFFTGEPKAPTPELGSCDNSIATTEFVCTTIANSFNDVELTGSPTAPTQEVGECSDTLATTAFVCDMLAALMNNHTMGDFPLLVDPGGLNINVSNGEITKPDGTKCLIQPLNISIGLQPNSLEYIYVRYLDCHIVASTESPNSNLGLLLGTAQTDDSKIVYLNQMAGSLSGWFNQHFKVGFGGRILPA